MLCAHARSGVGAVATQALVNPHFGALGLDLLARKFSPQKAIKTLIDGDDGRDHRQVHLINSQNEVAAHTGSACIEWCGHLRGETFSIAGNMLAGPSVLEETKKAFEKEKRLPFAERLLAALEAGEAAGGDKRGKQGAALRIHTTEDYPFLDLRVDDHEDPLRELRRLYDKSLERFQPFSACLPSKARPAGITDRAAIEAEVARFQTKIRGKEGS
jgi:uncharacterized Ntn-hydrolase superfamily protein